MKMSSWVPAAFAATGLLIGLVAGLSMSPVVGTLLPLLFGVIAGGAGFFVKQTPEHSRICGISLFLLSILCLLGFLLGIRERQGLSWSCLWSPCGESLPARVDMLELPSNGNNPDRLLHLVSIKIQLQHIQMEEKDRKLIFNLAKEPSTDIALMDQRLSNVAINYMALRQSLLSNPETGSAATSQPSPEDNAQGAATQTRSGGAVVRPNPTPGTFGAPITTGGGSSPRTGTTSLQTDPRRPTNPRVLPPSP